MRAMNPKTPIPQVSYQRHISFPLSTQPYPNPNLWCTTNTTRRERKREKRERRSSGLQTQTSAKSHLPEEIAEGGGHQTEVVVRLHGITETEAVRGPHGLKDL